MGYAHSVFVSSVGFLASGSCSPGLLVPGVDGSFGLEASWAWMGLCLLGPAVLVFGIFVAWTPWVRVSRGLDIAWINGHLS